MCDTLVAIGNATADGSVILAKNSDRAPNEAQRLVYLPHARHEAGAKVACTYIEVPQVPETYEIVLSQPFWLWGAEMGANECGVAIGNEAVFTREPYEKGPGLTGMDLLRLALERAATAREALEVITGLLGTYGQGGNCAFGQKLYYHNSFIIADPTEAWVLETAGRYWAAERVRSVRAISNALTIGREWDLASPGLVEHAIEKGWCRSREEFDFARCYSDPLMTWGAGGRPRQRRATELLTAHKGQITPATMMGFLRDHGPAGSDPRWHPSRGLRGTTLCMHALWGPLRSSQTAGSMVAHLAPDLQTFWLTGTSTPCTGLFKPVFLKGAGLPDIGPAPTGTADPASLWWTHERLHRAVIEDYAARLGLYRRERDALEGEFVAGAAELQARYRSAPPEERASALAAFTASCFTRAAEATARWHKAVTASPARRSPVLFSLAWRSYSRRAALR